MLMKEKNNYRADIDGLRAIAVLSVLFYHAKIKFFSGGFIGVDVFFVISGYLITGLIVKDILAKEFSLIKFYERRIRRIFPALFVVTVAVAITGGLIYNSDSYRELGKSIVASSTSMANMFFLSQAGYFDAPSLSKPLLHTWSLSVEEQFYVFLPLVLFLVIRYFPKISMLILSILLIASLSVNIYILQTNQDAAFYLAPLRAWELLVGSLIALKPVKLKPWLQNLLSTGGLIAILICVFTYSEGTLFPGLAAVVPVLGSALIINGDSDVETIVAKFLSLSPLVFIGKISYSLYLWHWPVIVFGKYYLIREPSPFELAGLLVMAFILSILSWKFVETPFRSRGFMSGAQIFGFSANVLAFILLIGVLIDFSGGFPLRFDKIDNLNQDDSQFDTYSRRNCPSVNNNADNYLTPKFCIIGDETKEPEFILWGDSHARAVSVGLNESATKFGKGGTYTFLNACPPLLGIGINSDKKCYLFNNEILKYIESNPNIKTIILAARWPFFAEGSNFKQDTYGIRKLIDLDEPEKAKDNATVFQSGLERTVYELTKLGREVIIISPIPEIGYNVPSALFIATITGRDLNNIISPTAIEFAERNKVVFAAIDKVSANANVKIINITNTFCNKKVCKVSIDNRILYDDSNHLSPFGSSLLTGKFNRIFNTQ
jgi:peptidoglycan/LPS O-acetylase OafA/YrhL